VNDETGLGVAPDTVKVPTVHAWDVGDLKLLSFFSLARSVPPVLHPPQSALLGEAWREARPPSACLQLPHEGAAGKLLLWWFRAGCSTRTRFAGESDTRARREPVAFDFVDKSNDAKPTKAKRVGDNERIVNVKPNGIAAAVYFPIEPKVVGEIKLLVTAIGDSAGDAVEQPLLVEVRGTHLHRTLSDEGLSASLRIGRRLPALLQQAGRRRSDRQERHEARAGDQHAAAVRHRHHRRVGARRSVHHR